MTTALLCPAMNVYAEARGQNALGQMLVAQVTLNRAEQDHKRVCSVVTAPAQFSWTRDCLDGRVVLTVCRPQEREAWEYAKKIAGTALAGATKVLTCADHFHATAMPKPDWARSMRVVQRFQGHIFYASTRVVSGCRVK